MSEAEDRETNEQLATRIQQAIRGVTERIQGYVQDVDRFSGEYNAEVERLQQLIQRLRECLDRLRALADGLNDINEKIMRLGRRIENLQERVATEVEAAGAGCREVLRNIENDLQGLDDLPGQFEIDIETLRTQVNDLEELIESLCGEAEDTISTMLTRRSAQINETLDRMQERDGGSGSGGDAETKSAPPLTPEGQGRDLRGNRVTPRDRRGRGQVAAMRAGIEGDVGQALRGRAVPTSPELHDARMARSGNTITYGPRSQRGQLRNVPRERLGFGSSTSTGRGTTPTYRGNQGPTRRGNQGGGWQTPEKLESLSRTRPVRTLAVLKNKKKKKTKKKKHRKRNKKTRGRNRRKKRSRKR